MRLNAESNEYPGDAATAPLHNIGGHFMWIVHLNHISEIISSIYILVKLINTLPKNVSSCGQRLSSPSLLFILNFIMLHCALGKTPLVINYGNGGNKFMLTAPHFFVHFVLHIFV
ncbi:hypothetical protein ACJX0J_019787, partial [Zea mays]